MILKRLVGYVAMLAEAGAAEVTIKFGPVLVSATFLPTPDEEVELEPGIGFKVDGEPAEDEDDEGDEDEDGAGRAVGFCLGD